MSLVDYDEFRLEKLQKTMSEKIGQRIKSERERRGISLQELAQSLAWSVMDLQDFEEERLEITPWELCEISKYLQVSVDILMGNAESLEAPYVLWREMPRTDKKLLEAQFIND